MRTHSLKKVLNKALYFGEGEDALLLWSWCHRGVVGTGQGPLLGLLLGF